jgi:uncharacterized protein (TIGR00369 family)
MTTLKGEQEYLGHGSIHGGITAAILDEIMALSATLKKRTLCVTAEINIRYLVPLTVGETYLVRANVVSDRIVLCETYGEILDEKLTPCVKASMKCVPIPRQKSLQIHPGKEKYHY